MSGWQVIDEWPISDQLLQTEKALMTYSDKLGCVPEVCCDNRGALQGSFVTTERCVGRGWSSCWSPFGAEEACCSSCGFPQEKDKIMGSAKGDDLLLVHLNDFDVLWKLCGGEEWPWRKVTVLWTLATLDVITTAMPHMSLLNANLWLCLFLPWPRVCHGLPLLKSCAQSTACLDCTHILFPLVSIKKSQHHEQCQ